MLSDNHMNDEQASARVEASKALLEAIREAAVQSKHASDHTRTQSYAVAARELAVAFSTMYRDA